MGAVPLKIVQVQFDGAGKYYDYFSDLELKINDKVIVAVNGERKIVTVKGFKNKSKYARSLIQSKVYLGKQPYYSNLYSHPQDEYGS